MSVHLVGTDGTNHRLVNGTNQVILQEVQDLKQKIQQSGHVSFLQEPEKKFWQELVDSNIRAGSLACLWCLKAQLNKRLSAAFNKWKLNATLMAIEEKRRKEEAEQKSKPLLEAISVLSKYTDQARQESSFLSRLADTRPKAFTVTTTTTIGGTQDQPNDSTPTRKPTAMSYSPHNESLDLLQDETEHFAKLSHALLDKDTDPETKRKVLMNMAKNFPPLTGTATAPTHPNSSSTAISDSLHKASLLPRAPIDHSSPSTFEKESWNEYQRSRSRSSLDLIGKDHPSSSQYPSNDSVHSRHSRQSHASRPQLPLSPSRVHQSQDELTQFLQFRRDSNGQYVKGLLASSPARPNSTPPHGGDGADDRFHHVLSQAARHLHKDPQHSSHPHQQHQHHHGPAHSKSRDPRRRSDSPHSTHTRDYYGEDDGDGGYHSDHHSQYSAYSDIKSTHSSGRSRSASPSAVPGYLQVTRSSLKKTRAASPPFHHYPGPHGGASSSSAGPPPPPPSTFGHQSFAPNNHQHQYPNVHQHHSQPSSRSSSRGRSTEVRSSTSRAPPTATAANTAHNAQLHRRPDPSDSEHRYATSNQRVGRQDRPIQVSSTHEPYDHHPQHHHQQHHPHQHHHYHHQSRHSGPATPPTASGVDGSTSFASPQFYDASHYPHLDNSPVTKAALESSSLNFEAYHHRVQKARSSSHEGEGGDDQEEYHGKDLLALSAMSHDGAGPSHHQQAPPPPPPPPSAAPSTSSLPSVVESDYVVEDVDSVSHLSHRSTGSSVPSHHSHQSGGGSHHSSGGHHHNKSHPSSAVPPPTSSVVSSSSSYESYHPRTDNDHSAYDEDHQRGGRPSYDSRRDPHHLYQNHHPHPSQHQHHDYHPEDAYHGHHPSSRHHQAPSSGQSVASQHSHYSQQSRRSHTSQQSHHTQRSSATQRTNRSSQSYRSQTSHHTAATGGMERAQWKLLYGDLQDVGRKDWECSLRR